MATLTVESNSAFCFSRQNRLRLGVLLDSLTMPKWASHLLQEIEKSPAAELVVLVTNDGAPSARTEVRTDPIPKMLQLWFELDRKLFAGRSPNPDINKTVLFTPTNGCVIAQNRGDCRLSARTAAELHSMQLDLILNLSSPDFGAELQKAAKHGVCWFNDDRDLLKELFWFLKNDAVVESTINIRSNGHATTTLPARYSPIDKYSFFRNFGLASEKRWTALQRYLAEIQCDGGQSVSTIPLASRLPVHAAPGNIETVVLILRLLGRMLREQWTKRVRSEGWFIAFRRVQPVEDRNVAEDGLTLLRPPAGHFYADPFAIDKNDKTYIFFEDYCYASQKAAISFVVIDSNGKCSSPDVALEEEYHLSFPSLFEWDGEIYLLPETKDNRTVQLYRAIEFPHRWELSHVLLQNVSAVDSTLLRYENKFWLFTCGLNSRHPWFDGDDELFLFSADSLNGPWAAHPKNPIVADVRNCRSAGQIMQWGNQLIRPAQDCAAHYGSAVVFNHIEVLSDDSYRETPIARIARDWLPGNRGTHTFNRSHSYEVWDGRTLVGKFWKTRREPHFERAMLMKSLFRPV